MDQSTRPHCCYLFLLLPADRLAAGRFTPRDFSSSDVTPDHGPVPHNTHTHTHTPGVSGSVARAKVLQLMGNAAENKFMKNKCIVSLLDWPCGRALRVGRSVCGVVGGTVHAPTRQSDSYPSQFTSALRRTWWGLKHEHFGVHHF